MFVSYKFLQRFEGISARKYHRVANLLNFASSDEVECAAPLMGRREKIILPQNYDNLINPFWSCRTGMTK
jgi:hypothetical protein